MSKLEEAKSNLKNVLDKFEKVVEENLLQKEGTLASEVNNRIQTLESEVKDKGDEITYLREQNSELQAQVGEIQQQNFKLQNKNQQAVKKVDAIIGEVKSYMNNNEMF